MQFYFCVTTDLKKKRSFLPIFLFFVSVVQNKNQTFGLSCLNSFYENGQMWSNMCIVWCLKKSLFDRLY